MKQKFLFLLLSLMVSSLAIGQTKTCIIDKKDGFIWYKLKRGNYYGAQDINGKIIIPIKYDDVEYETSGDGEHFFEVRKGYFKGVYTRKGTLVIPTERNYTSIFANVENEKMCFVVWSNGNRKGVCDLRGKEVMPPIYEIIGFEAVTVFTPETHPYDSDIHYFCINRNGKWGICNMDGDIVVQPTLGHYPLLSRSEYEHNKKDGIYYDSDSKITNINLTADTRFDYTPYDDLYYKYSYSYPSESSNSSSSSSSSNSSSSSSSSNSSSTNTIEFESIIAGTHGTSSLSKAERYRVKFEFNPNSITYTLESSQSYSGSWTTIETHTVNPSSAQIAVSSNGLTVSLSENRGFAVSTSTKMVYIVDKFGNRLNDYIGDKWFLYHKTDFSTKYESLKSALLKYNWRVKN